MQCRLWMRRGRWGLFDEDGDDDETMMTIECVALFLLQRIPVCLLAH